MESRYKRYKKSYQAYLEKNKAVIRNMQKIWHQKNPEKNKEYRIKARPKRREFIDKVRFGIDRKLIFERDNWSCQECGLTNVSHINEFGNQLTIDHIDGNGRNNVNPNNEINNLRTLCLRCHGRKDILKRKWRPVHVKR